MERSSPHARPAAPRDAEQGAPTSGSGVEGQASPAAPRGAEQAAPTSGSEVEGQASPAAPREAEQAAPTSGSGRGLARRELLRLVGMGASLVGAVAFTGCTAATVAYQRQSRVLVPEDEVSAYENWYATACTGCSAGCGALVRIVAGRAKKVEGNPDHPVNQGKLCARGQALVQTEYHPDRLTGPQQRTGPRGAGTGTGTGTGSFSATSWDAALDQLAAALSQAQGRTPAAIALLTGPASGHQGTLLATFAQAVGADWLPLEPLAEAPLAAAAQRVFGPSVVPTFDIQNAQYVLSFGADFLSTWLSPVHYGVQYGIFRQGSTGANAFQPRSSTGRARGYLVQVEPRLSLTAASADDWLWVRPGTEGLLALSLAQVILAEGLAHPAAGSTTTLPSAGELAAYQPEQVADAIGVSADQIRQVARDFSAARPALALGGGSAGAQTNGTDALAAILALNLLVGAVGQPGGVQLGTPSPLGGLLPAVPTVPSSASSSGGATVAAWQALADRLRAGQYQVVLVAGANPVYELPAALHLAAALQQAPLVVSFTSLLDDTGLQADLLLPASPALESWGDSVPAAAPGSGTAVLTLQQPVVPTLYDTRAVEDALLQLAHRLGGAAAQALPWSSYKEMLQAQLAPLQQLAGGSVPPQQQPVAFWEQLLQQGGWWTTTTTPSSSAPVPVPVPVPAPAPAAPGPYPTSLPPPQMAGSATDYPYYLLPFVHNSLGSGQGAALPWLQAAPDPVTTVVWTTWAEVNPALAQQLGLSEGDVVRLQSPVGSIEVPVYISPAAPPEVIAVPLGQGHAASASGRWAQGRGQNPLALLAPLADSATGALAYAATRVQVTKTGRQVAVPKLEGGVPAYQLAGGEVLQTAPG